jgi:hypothetical protein
MQTPSPSRATWILIVFPLAVMLTSCKKKEETVAAPPAPETAAPVAQAPAQQPQEQTPVDVTPITTAPADNAQALTAAENLRKTRDYEAAAATLLQIQQRQLSEAQAAAAHAAMLQLQRDLINGVASGDAKAKKAADLLRASHSR